MNMNLVRAKIVECGLTQKQLAKALGMSSNALSRKLNENSDFTISEVRQMCRILHIKDPVRVFDLGIAEGGKT